MIQEKTLMNAELRDQVRRYQAEAKELVGLNQSLESARSEQQETKVLELQGQIRTTNDRLQDSYQAIFRLLAPQLEAKARQGRIGGEPRALVDDVLSNCLAKIDPDHEGLAAYFSKACSAQITDYHRRSKKENRLPFATRSGDEAREAEARPMIRERAVEADDLSPEGAELKVFDPEAYRRQQLARLAAEYAERKRSLIDGLHFSSAARVTTLLTDQRQRMARLLDSSEYPRVEITALTERRELWSVEDAERDIDTGLRKQPAAGTPTLAGVWEAMSDRVRTSQQDIGQQLVVDAIGDCGGSVSHQTWRQRVKRYMDELDRQLDPQDLLLFLL